VCALLSQASAVGQATAPEVRKAIPIAQPSSRQDARKYSPGSTAMDSSDRGLREQYGSLPGEPRGQVDGRGPATAPASPALNTMKGLNDKRRIGIRDKLSFTIVEDEGPARVMTVTDAGEVDVPYIGRVAVDNRTCKELATYIKGLLEKEYYYQATVLIGLDSAGGQVLSKGRYYIDGQVGRTGAHEIPVDEVLTISKAIIRAGGFTQYADRKGVRLLRRNPATGQMEIREIDVRAIIEKGQARDDLEILPDDKIIVKEKFFNF
jgi:protein involved in polysaccharide export with SLBB domain